MISNLMAFYAGLVFGSILLMLLFGCLAVAEWRREHRPKRQMTLRHRLHEKWAPWVQH